jgi:hypothetical protein
MADGLVLSPLEHFLRMKRWRVEPGLPLPSAQLAHAICPSYHLLSASAARPSSAAVTLWDASAQGTEQNAWPPTHPHAFPPPAWHNPQRLPSSPHNLRYKFPAVVLLMHIGQLHCLQENAICQACLPAGAKAAVRARCALARPGGPTAGNLGAWHGPSPATIDLHAAWVPCI